MARFLYFGSYWSMDVSTPEGCDCGEVHSGAKADPEESES